MINLSELNSDLIEKLALDNPIVHSFLIMQKRGDFSSEQALIGMVYYLCVHNKELVKLDIDRISMSGPPVGYDRFRQEIK